LELQVYNDDVFSVSPTTISSDATSTTVTITCTPNLVGQINDTLNISGADFSDDIEAALTVTGTCVAPANVLAFNTPVELTLSGDEVDYTITPTAETGNGGSITYAFTDYTGSDAIIDNTGDFMTSATGTYLVTATQAVNGTTCGGTATITINVVSPAMYTINFNAGSGTCQTETMENHEGASITLPVASPSMKCADEGWTFAGWATEIVSETQTAPTLLTGDYIIQGNADLYAVYSKGGGSQETVFNFENIASANEWNNGEAYTSVMINPITIAANGGGNNGKYYTSDKTWRMYSGGSITITTTDGAVTAVSSTPSKTFTISDGSASLSLSETVKFTSITVTTSSSSTYNSNPECLETVVTPTISPESGTYYEAQSVTITCETPDATIYYTIDSSEPSSINGTAYTNPISVNETMTIKAIAVKEGMNNSDVASATYTIVTPITIAEVRAQGTGSVYTQGTVTSCVGTTAYIQDATAAVCVYGSELTVGDNILIQGTLTTYNGLLEITSPTITVVSSGNTVTPTVKTIAEINTDYAAENALQGWYITIENATVTAISGQNTTIVQGENTIVVRGISGVDYAVNDILTLNGNIGCYNAAQIANPQNVVVAPHIYTITATANPIEGGTVTGAGEFEEGEQVTLTATANNGYDFIGWYDNNGIVATTAEYSFSATTNRTLEARFAAQHTVTFDAGTGSCISSLTGSSVELPEASPSDLCGSQSWTFAGWSTSAVTETTTAPTLVNSPYTPSEDITLFAVYSKTEAGSGTSTPASYVKVTSGPSDWSGDYLIVYETDNVAFDGGLETLDATSNTISVTISNNTIESTSTTDAAIFTITAINGGYSILSASGKYIGQTSYANGLTASDNAIANTISFDNNSVLLTCSTSGGDVTLKYNFASNQNRFRYYKSGQQDIQLYKYVAGTSGTTTYNSNPECVVLYHVSISNNTSTNGTFTIDPVEATEGTTITLTPSVNEHYHLTGWEFEDSEGLIFIDVEDNQFTMPASDVYVSMLTAPDEYNITTTASPAAGGTITGAGSYTYGSTATLTATPAENYHFVKWDDNNTDNPREVTVTADASYTATFAIDQHTITAVSADDNMGTVSGGGNYDYNTTPP